DLKQDSSIHPWFGMRRDDQPVVAIDKVRYTGDPVAVIVAESEEIAAEALFDVDVDYEELPYVIDAAEAAKPDAPVIHDKWPDNECGDWLLEHGDLEKGWQEADHVFENVYSSPSANHVPMEPHVSIARWNDDQNLEVWTSTQTPHGVRGTLAQILKTDPEHVRVHTFNLGGGYGAKGGTKMEPMAVLAARKAGRPVRIALSREEVFLTIAKHAAQVRMKTGVKEDGTFVAREVDVLWNTGAYAISSPRATQQGMVRAPGPYRTPNVRVTSRGYYTNTVPTGPFRGAMTSQVCWAYEQQTDEIAAALGLDPVEIRRKNLLRDGDTFATGEMFPHVHYHDLLDEVTKAIDWKPEDARVKWDRKAKKVRGKGVALLIKHTVTPSRSEARVSLTPDGACRVFSSSVEMGQGARTTLLQFVADELGLPLEKISAIQPDTNATPFDTTTSSSRTAYSMSFALREASTELKEKLAEIAAPLLEVSSEDVEVGGGRVNVVGNPETGLDYATVLREAKLDELSGEGVFQSPEGYGVLDEKGQGIATVHWHEGALGLEIEVDTTTGKISVVNCHATSYAGRILNPVMVRQQNEGNVIMGLGPSMFEEYVFDSGQLVNPNLSDYMIPSFLDLPEKLTSRSLESDDPNAEIHGVGEMTIPVVAPAIGNALYHATGVRVYDMPLTAERVFRALHGAAKEEVS
ncbi:MAG: xanthine dehydrogenase family protein molybdopterin-binding subunit, partial [Chloroflexota bacterium]